MQRVLAIFVFLMAIIPSAGALALPAGRMPVSLLLGWTAACGPYALTA
jgi:hypothetical protein